MDVREFPPDPTSAADARAFVRNALAGQCEAEPSDLAVMLTAELVADAIRDTTAPYRLEIACDGASVRIEVTTQHGSWPPLQHPTEDEVDSAYQLVQSLAAAWGVAAHGDTRRVWFEVPCRTPVSTEANDT